ncbi:MAG TPA: branched-chain amino acid transaminase [Candidatus Saccharimonadales bacterium]|nr:branched-chain amino acid transaminase [Candidatus Saccharimonadales bacterium]
MAIDKVDHIWMNGKLVRWDDAKIHVMSHVVHYGSGVFEGMRAYETPKGAAAFRLPEHVTRLFDSAKIYRMEIPYTPPQISEAILETIRVNKLQSCYVRPVVYRGYGSIGVNPAGCPIDVAIAAFPWGKYLGPEALEQGVAVRVASWTRMAPNTFPALAKSAANYMNSQLIKMEAIADGYAEGIALDARGLVSEGSGENLFLVRGGVIYTPPMADSVLLGITRSSVLALAADLGIPVREESIPREMLYIADEVFMTGSAAEVTPISSVDRIPIGKGARGPVTRRLQEAFFDVIEGRRPDTHKWLTPVYEGVAVAGRAGK